MKQAFLFFFLSLLLPVLSPAQNLDTSLLQKDSLQNTIIADSVASTDSSRVDSSRIDSLRQDTISKKRSQVIPAPPISLQGMPRILQGKETLFYILTGLVLMLAFFRYFFARYFSNLFRVFFNSSLRQSQLTDQLLQAKLPSLLFNLFFIVSGGFYIYLLLIYYRWIPGQDWLAAGICVGTVGVIYLGKYSTLKFTGWITGHTDTVNIYVFIVFLINKIIGIFLVPFIILISFSEPDMVKIAVICSLMLTGAMLILRFFRSYGILQNQLKVSRFHFFLYITGIEILPLLLIYKALMVLLDKNL